MKVYVAGPLFNEMERERNSRMKQLLEGLGFEVYLPQEHGGLLQDLVASSDASTARARIFANDISALRGSDILLCLLDGRVPDEGMCVELGMAHALGKVCVGYKTDPRRHDATGENNLMVDGCLTGGVAANVAELEALLGRLKGG